jgi:hypothetical protein
MSERDNEQRLALINAIEAVPSRFFKEDETGKDDLIARLKSGRSLFEVFSRPVPPVPETSVRLGGSIAVENCTFHTNTTIEFAQRVRAETDAIARMLIEKNAAYGNSALDPLRVFSTAAPAEQIRVRIDDKLSRLARGSAAGEDVILDLIGYLILLRMAETKTP